MVDCSSLIDNSITNVTVENTLNDVIRTYLSDNLPKCVVAEVATTKEKRMSLSGNCCTERCTSYLKQSPSSLRVLHRGINETNEKMGSN